MGRRVGCARLLPIGTYHGIGGMGAPKPIPVVRHSHQEAFIAMLSD
jgi:hypothetical protein